MFIFGPRRIRFLPFSRHRTAVLIGLYYQRKELFSFVFFFKYRV